jgi:hypothetical protein
MKNLLNKALVALVVFGTTAQMQAYSYIFSNHTNQEVGVAMRYHGLGEPRYYRWIPAHQARQFTPKTGDVQREGGVVERGIEDRKIGFVAKTFWYVKTPTTAQKLEPKNIAWHEFQITWMPTEAYKLAIALYEAIGKTTVDIAKIAVDIGVAVATEGASIPVQAALKSAQGGDIMGGLTTLINAVGQSAARSMMTDRHIDIIEDKDGIKFISQL